MKSQGLTSSCRTDVIHEMVKDELAKISANTDLISLVEDIINHVVSSKATSFEKLIASQESRRLEIQRQMDTLMNQMEKLSNAAIIEKFEEKRMHLKNDCQICENRIAEIKLSQEQLTP